jgi:superfamily II DNA helicase RecQ
MIEASRTLDHSRKKSHNDHKHNEIVSVTKEVNVDAKMDVGDCDNDVNGDDICLSGSDDDSDDEDDDDNDENESLLIADEDGEHGINDDDADFDTTTMDDDCDSSPVFKILRDYFGHKQFRSGQEWAINRTIDGKNSLLVMPTGAGKSLCYMMPAALLPGLTIVVSPLIALMHDQLRKLPVQLPGACLSGDLSTHKVSKITVDVLNGLIKVLYVSPERLSSPSFRKLIQTLNYLTVIKDFHTNNLINMMKL